MMAPRQRTLAARAGLPKFGGVDRDSERSGADRLVRRQLDDVEQQRHRQDRPAATDQSEREPTRLPHSTASTA
jgi:hypothetical protein